MAHFTILKKRADFLAASRAIKSVTPSMIVQARDRRDGDCATRVGYTCSKKVGGAVTRNRAKRRLRAAAHNSLGSLGRPGWDYVLIGRAKATASMPFHILEKDLTRAIETCHANRMPRMSQPQASERQ
ncbi:MAG: ribonuclease P protein component [Pseudomonadota bacterium]